MQLDPFGLGEARVRLQCRQKISQDSLIIQTVDDFGGRPWIPGGSALSVEESSRFVSVDLECVKLWESLVP